MTKIESDITESNISQNMMTGADVHGDVPSYTNLGILALIQLLGGMTFSLMSPFYPEEAVQKGMNITETGIVYSITFFMPMMCSPIFGKYIEIIGSRKMFFFGTLIAGFGNAGFGLLQWVDGKHVFLGLSLIIRIISAMAEAALFTAVSPLTINAASEPTDKLMGHTDQQLNFNFFY